MAVDDTDSDPVFFAGFLDEYFAECDEHLTLARRVLLALEGSVNQPQVNRGLLEDLFRSFHSLKGISGMVGVREAERLAHAIEDYFRTLRNEQVPLSAEGMDALIIATRILEEVINARRVETDPPDIEPILEKLALVTAAASPTQNGALTRVEAPTGMQVGLSVDEQDRVRSARDEGLRIWRFEFRPASILAVRGVNVNSTRARLQEIGELIHAAPRVSAVGGVTFEFIVATAADEAVFSSWREDGLSYASLNQEQVAASSIDDQITDPFRTEPTISRPQSQMVRVELDRLDELMRMVGELVISRSHLENKLGAIEALLTPSDWRSLQETSQVIGRQLRDLREGIMQTRMVPIGEIFERMQFVIRDLAREFRRPVKLELHGQETEIDKFLVERMMDPLLHLVRNAISHGFESVEDRLAEGKPAEGNLSLRAFTSGAVVIIEIEDDGRGINAELVAQRAASMGLNPSVIAVDDERLLDLICAPGLSTREAADRASGRGVGMAVVQKTILDLGGSLSLSTVPGEGTRFTIELPLTLAIADALIAKVKGQLFAVPQAAVREVIQIDASTIRSIENNEIMPYRGGVLPLLRLDRYFHLHGAESRTLHAFVAGNIKNPVAIVVDRILGQREIVVRPMTDPLVQVNGISGATELGDGRPILIIDALALVRTLNGTRRIAMGQNGRENIPSTFGEARPTLANKEDEV